MDTIILALSVKILDAPESNSNWILIFYEEKLAHTNQDPEEQSDQDKRAIWPGTIWQINH